MSRLLILVALVGMVSAAFLLAAKSSLAADQGAVPDQSAIEQMATIPSGDLKVIESKGELLFMGSNGRFIIKGGVLYDAWNRKALRTVADVHHTANRVDFSAMKINVTDFRPLSLGTGAKHVTVFVDPRCPWCAKLMSLVRDTPRLREEYTFDLLPIPVLGQESQALVRQLGCAKDRNAARDALIEEAYKAPLAQIDACDLAPLQKTLVFAQLLGVNGVPYLIAHDGRIQRGIPVDLVAWLEDRTGSTPAASKAKQ